MNGILCYAMDSFIINNYEYLMSFSFSYVKDITSVFHSGAHKCHRYMFRSNKAKKKTTVVKSFKTPFI